MSQLELKVILDTSAIFSSSGNHLFSTDAESIIESFKSSSVLKITCYLPEVVLLERHAQIKKRGTDLLPQSSKLEEILGSSFGVSADLIGQKTKDALEKQVAEHNINIVPLDIASVDWNTMMLNAVYRNPPFEPGDKEKGFRDALIAETMIQIVSKAPSDPEICIIAIVVKDALLLQTLKDRLTTSSNVRFLASIPELEGQIKALETVDASEGKFTEAYLASRQAVARKFFFEPGHKESLYYKENIREQIESQYYLELFGLDSEWAVKRLYTDEWYIAPPIFAGEDGNRLKWISRILVHMVGTTFTSDTLSPYTGKSNRGYISANEIESSLKIEESFYDYPEPFKVPLGEHAIGTGRAVFVVEWSVMESAKSRTLLDAHFEKPEINQIVFAERAFGMG